MKRLVYLWSGIWGIVFLAAGCASTVHVKKDDDIDFRKYKTFAWIESENSNGRDANHNDLTAKKIKEAVNKELKKSAGWKESKNRPDVLLSYDVLVERTNREQTDPVYSMPFTRTFFNPYSRRYVTVFYPSQFMGYDRYQVPVREGTVTITMIDAKSNKTIWQGWTTDMVNSTNLTNKEIQNAVRSIFRKFDVAKN
jgi:hypothetical protein